MFIYSPTSYSNRTGKRVLFRKYGVVLCEDDDNDRVREYENKEQ